jgi:hypothetical protein
VGTRFVEFVENSPAAQGLGRKGNSSLLSCEDSLLARLAYRAGYSCSYQPSLRLYHYLPASRFRLKYLVRLLYGLGRSYVLLDRILGKRLSGTPASVNTLSVCVALFRRFFGRLLDHRAAGPIMWSWDVGELTELYRQHHGKRSALRSC